MLWYKRAGEYSAQRRCREWTGTGNRALEPGRFSDQFRYWQRVFGLPAIVANLLGRYGTLAALFAAVAIGIVSRPQLRISAILIESARSRFTGRKPSRS